MGPDYQQGGPCAAPLDVSGLCPAHGRGCLAERAQRLTPAPDVAEAVLADVMAAGVDAWFEVKFIQEHRSVLVSLTAAAHLALLERFGPYDVVVTWEEFNAAVAGCMDAEEGPARQQRLREALMYFAARQGLSRVP